MWVKESLPEFGCEVLEGVSFCQELILIVFYPIIDFDVLERHENIMDFIIVINFAFVKVRVKVLKELSEDCRRNHPFRENRCCFVCIVKFDSCHVEMGR